MTREVMQQALAALELIGNEDDCNIDQYAFASHGGNAAIIALRKTLEQPATSNMEIVGYQFQWTNPADDPDLYNNPIEWQAVIPARDQTEQSKVDELLAYRYAGKPVYRVRALYTPKETT